MMTEEPPKAFQAQVLAVQDEEVSLQVAWTVPLEEIETVPGMLGRVRVHGELQAAPGSEQWPSGKLFSGELTLLGEEIPRFLRGMPAPCQWASGRSEELAKRHRLVPGAGRLTLVLRREDIAGVGRVLAVPTLIFGSLRFEAAAIWRGLAEASQYVRADDAWLEAEPLRQRGFDTSGNAADGTFIQPIQLNPEEVLRRGSLRLRGGWDEIQSFELELPTGHSPRDTAALHLEFLRTWGLPGGLLGSVTDLAGPLCGFLASCHDRFPNCRILLVGARTSLGALAEGWQVAGSPVFASTLADVGQSAQSSLVAATPLDLEENPALQATRWNIVFLLDADVLVRSASSGLFRNLLRLRRELVLGIFHGIDFLRRALPRGALCRLFGLASYSNLWKYSLRSPDSPPGSGGPSGSGRLPAPFLMAAAASPAGPLLPEFRMNSRPPSGAMAIPPRQVVPSQEAVTFQSPLAAEVLTRQGSRFIDDALDLAEVVEPPTPFVPFSRNFPAYTDMTAGQLRYYLHWRGEARQEHYLAADRGYLLLHLYELINNVTVDDSMDGYQAMRRLWLNYRREHVFLDESLVDWQVDYVLLNNCTIDPLQVYQEAFGLMGRIPSPEGSQDLALSLFLDLPWTEWPLAAIEVVLNYRLRWGEFWLGGHDKELERMIPIAIQAVDRSLRERQDKGILAVFQPRGMLRIERYPFQGARYRGDLHKLTVATVLPYSRSLEFRNLMTAVVQTTENILRGNWNFPLQAELVPLEPSLRQVLEDAMRQAGQIPATFSSSVPAPAKRDSRMILDLDRVRDLLEESSELQRLLAPLEESAGHAFAIPDLNSELGSGKTALPAGATEGVDLPEGWLSFGQRLHGYQVNALRVLLEPGDAKGKIVHIAQSQALMPELLLDSINELALETIGDFLVVPNSTPPELEEEGRKTLPRLLAMIDTYAC